MGYGCIKVFLEQKFPSFRLMLYYRLRNAENKILALSVTQFLTSAQAALFTALISFSLGWALLAFHGVKLSGVFS